MAASTISRSTFLDGTTPWNASTISASVYDKIDEMFGGVGTYATLELGGALKINGALTQLTNDGGALGTSSLGWSDLFLASGGVINWNNGDVTITHGSNVLTLAGASSGYRVTDGNLYVGAVTQALATINLLTGGQGGGIQLIRNTSAQPTSGQSLGAFAWKGIDSGNSNAAGEAMIEAVAAENFSGATAATELRFYTKSSGTGPGSAPTEVLRLSSSQEMLIGYTTDNGAYKLQVNSQIFATNATIATSDGRFKTDVQPVREGLAAVKALQPVQFKWKKHPVHNFIDGTDVGFIAQDVRAALAGRDYTGAVVTTNGTGANEFLGMADAKLIPLLVAAVQELSAEVNALKAH